MINKEELNLFNSINFKIDTAGYLDVGAEWKNMVDAFPYIRLYYIRSGSAVLNLNNKQVLLKEGYLYFIPSFSVVNGTSNSMGHYFIHLVPSSANAHILSALKPMDSYPLEKSHADFLFTSIITNYKNNELKNQIVTDSGLKILLSYFMSENTSFFNSNSNIQRFFPVFEYIDKNLGNKIYIKDLSGLLYLDDTYFSNLFKLTFGISIKQYILEKKIEQAKAMIINGIPTHQIAEYLNFYDTASFAKYFKKKTSLTPKEFYKKVHE